MGYQDKHFPYILYLISYTVFWVCTVNYGTSLTANMHKYESKKLDP